MMKKLYALLTLALLFSIGAYAQDPAEPEFTLAAPNQPSDLFVFSKTYSYPKPALQPDGKVIVNSGKGLERIAGNLRDNSFNALLSGEYFPQYMIDQILALPNGKVIVTTTMGGVVGAETQLISRLNTNGSLDTTFAYPFEFASFMALQTDGKVLVSSAPTNGATAIYRLNDDGSLDPTFNFQAGQTMGSHKFLALPDGKILFVSMTGSIKHIKRLNSDGSIDNTYFAGSGFDLSAEVYCFLALPDGKVLVGGKMTSYNDFAFGNLMRLNADGTVDTAFQFDPDPQSAALGTIDLGVQATGKIIAVFNESFYDYSFNSTYSSVLRLNTDGSIDTSFDINFPKGARSVTILPNQDMIIQTSAANNDWGELQFDSLAKIDSEGNLDATFNNGPGFSSTVRAIASQANNKVLIGGYFRNLNGSAQKFFARLNADGTLDDTFNVAGTGFSNFVNDIVVQPDNKIIIVGAFNEYNGSAVPGVVRLNPDGSIDTSFAPTFTGMAAPYVVTIQPDGKILLGGNFTISHLNRSYRSMIRLNANGTIDTSFFTQGDNTVGFQGSVHAIVMQPDGKILVGGKFSGFYLCNICIGMDNLVRLNADGTRDTSLYNINLFNNGNNIPVHAIALEANGNILVGGSFTQASNLPNTDYFIRLTPWGTNLGTTYPGGIVKSIVVQPDGKILLAGGQSLKRCNQDLTADPTFNTGVGFNGIIAVTAVRPDGVILTGGEFTTYKGEAARRFIALQGDDFYAVQGVNRFDIDDNGCTVTDVAVPFLKLSVSNGTTSIPNSTGSYNVALGNGNHTITPILENPQYFTVTPASINVDFPSQAAPIIQDFCIAGLGTHHDLEVTILPLADARPGFDAKYRILYKNKGTEIESGAVTFSFDGAVADVVTTSPAFDSATSGSVTFNFSQLYPLESRFAEVILNYNTPQESPALIGGENLVFNATTDSSVDETPNNNIFDLPQTVVNAYDPNDKKCLQGNMVGSEVVGQYVHYMIRFENVGNGNALNISVRDQIDLSKFDITTLVPLHGSHLFTTTIYDGNRVQFFFENINLPFADGANDGYVAFKIKTVNTLEVGDSFSNSAAIYFDYNAPITTNNEVTNIEVLAADDFKLADEFIVYPNPVDDILEIYSSGSANIRQIEVYSISGQLLVAMSTAPNSKVDVSHLAAGVYFIKFSADDRVSVVKFVKK